MTTFLLRLQQLIGLIFEIYFYYFVPMKILCDCFVFINLRRREISKFSGNR